MVKITIEIKFEVEQLTLELMEAAHKAMEEIMMAAYHEWQDEAGRKLNTTRRAYRDAIQHKVVSPGEVELFLQGTNDKDNWIANALEAGCPTFNIRDGVLKGAKLHPERMAHMSEKQRRRMFAYLKSVGRLGLPPTAYSDVGFMRAGTKEGKPSEFRRISKNHDTKSSWEHPGFKPAGTGGLGEPLRNAVVKFVEENAPEIFNKLLSKVAA